MKQEQRIILIKEAGIIGALSSYVGTVFDKNDIVGSIAKIATNTVLAYYLGIPWAIFGAIIQYGFNIDVSDILSKLVSTVVDYFTGHGDKPVDADATADALADKTIQTAGLPSDKLEQPISEEMLSIAGFNRNSLIKEAGAATFVASWLGKTQGGFIKKVLFTIIKSIIIGGGLGVVGAAVAGGIRGSLPGQPAAQPETPATPEPASGNDQPVPTTRRQPTSVLHYVGQSSGYGTDQHLNDADKNDTGANAWYATNDQGDFARTIWSWIFKVYPNMRRPVAVAIQQNYLRAVSPVIQTIRQFNDNMNSNLVRMPNKINGKSITSKKDVVDVVLGLMIVQ